MGDDADPLAATAQANDHHMAVVDIVQAQRRRLRLQVILEEFYTNYP